jgi:hypothetical protein
MNDKEAARRLERIAGAGENKRGKLNAEEGKI